MVAQPRIILHNDETRHLASKLHAHLPEAEIRECNSYEALPELINTFCPEIVYSVRFNGTPGYPRNALFDSKSLRWIANGGAGTDHFGLWDPEQVTVTNTAGVAADMMAEYVIGGFLHFTLNVQGLQTDKKSRIWASRQMIPLKGKTLLIIGLGNTGMAVAKRAQAFGMKVIGTKARPESVDNVDEVHASDQLQQLVPRADFIAVCTPLTSNTKGMIDRSVFSAAKKSLVLADVSRGGVIVQNDLIEALKGGSIAGAVLDVFETEPLPIDNPLWDLPNTLLSPHCSSVYEGWESASFEMFLSNLDRWIASEPLTNVVDPVRGY